MYSVGIPFILQNYKIISFYEIPESEITCPISPEAAGKRGYLVGIAGHEKRHCGKFSHPKNAPVLLSRNMSLPPQRGQRPLRMVCSWKAAVRRAEAACRRRDASFESALCSRRAISAISSRERMRGRRLSSPTSESSRITTFESSSMTALRLRHQLPLTLRAGSSVRRIWRAGHQRRRLMRSSVSTSMRHASVKTTTGINRSAGMPRAALRRARIWEAF